MTFTQTMKWLRKYNLDNQSMPKVSDEMLQGYKPMFAAANQLPLWEYMHNAWLFYQQKDYARSPKAIQLRHSWQRTISSRSANRSLRRCSGDAGKLAGCRSPLASSAWHEACPYQQQYLQQMLTPPWCRKIKLPLFLPLTANQ
ncbi:Uncharacterised protein [Serratia fonticola]|uniref:Uncharacterized protein n=1 Tax=Serratia fonticola TaxID=47917 RepID=A0A4U9W660_SERFO|nr:Uncharacterised protein [Serratia fonticola]